MSLLAMQPLALLRAFSTSNLGYIHIPYTQRFSVAPLTLAHAESTLSHPPRLTLQRHAPQERETRFTPCPERRQHQHPHRNAHPLISHPAKLIRRLPKSTHTEPRRLDPAKPHPHCRRPKLHSNPVTKKPPARRNPVANRVSLYRQLLFPFA
jgi:hypothetical protein